MPVKVYKRQEDTQTAIVLPDRVRDKGRVVIDTQSLESFKAKCRQVILEREQQRQSTEP